VKIKNRDAEILLGSEFDLGPSRDLMKVGLERGLNLVVVDPKAGFFRCPGRLG
jgi:hypothetical protein